MEHGRQFEDTAKKELQQIEGIVNIELCGLFVDSCTKYLGATLDGIIDKNTLLESKCPYTAYNLKMSPEETIDNKSTLGDTKG